MLNYTCSGKQLATDLRCSQKSDKIHQQVPNLLIAAYQSSEQDWGFVFRVDMAISLLALSHTNLDGYNKYIASQEWRDRANLAKERDGYQCRTCTSTEALEVHHRTYERFGHEDLDDLITLCKACHDAITSSIRFRRYESREIRVYDAGRTTPTYKTIGDQNVKQDFEVQDSRRITPVDAQWAVSRPIEQDYTTDETDYKKAQ